MHALLGAYQERRRRELGDLWRVIAFANHDPEHPEAALPAEPVQQAEPDEDGFDAVAMVRRSREGTERG